MRVVVPAVPHGASQQHRRPYQSYVVAVVVGPAERDENGSGGSGGGFEGHGGGPEYISLEDGGVRHGCGVGDV